MAKIHYMKDKDGNTIYPVTHADAILGLENISGNNDTFDEEVVDANDITELKGKRLTGEDTLNLPADATTWGILETVLDNENDGYQTFIPEYGEWAGTVAIRYIADHGSTLGAWYWQLDTASWGDYLLTNDKTIIGAINELFQSADSGKQLIANAIGEPLSSDDTFSAMSNDINSLLSTFKTNMMNNGITVESSDKFKALIDKIATLADNEGKGIRYAEGVADSINYKNFYRHENNSATHRMGFIEISIPFEPTLIYAYTEYKYIANEGSSYTSYTSDVIFDNIKNEYTSAFIYAYTNSINLYRVLNDYSNGVCHLPVSYAVSTESTTPISTCHWYAIGVGEEDTTLRDSLASILESNGVDVSDEDDMAGLITKVDTAFDNLVPKKIYLYNRGTEYTTITLGTSNGVQTKESDHLYINGAYFNGALTGGSMTISYTYNTGDENKYLYLDLNSNGGTLRIGSIYDGVSYTLGGRGLLRLDLSEAPSFTGFSISSTDSVQIYEMYTSNI